MYWKRFRKTENNASLVDRHIPVKAPSSSCSGSKERCRLAKHDFFLHEHAWSNRRQRSAILAFVAVYLWSVFIDGKVWQCFGIEPVHRPIRRDNSSLDLWPGLIPWCPYCAALRPHFNAFLRFDAIDHMTHVGHTARRIEAVVPFS